MTVKLILWEVLCAALFYSVFCRLVKAGKTTRLDIRIAIFLLGLASLVGFGAPLYDWTPDIVSLIILGAVVLMQTVTARHWVRGVPRQFVDSQYHPRERRQQDGSRT